MKHLMPFACAFALTLIGSAAQAGSDCAAPEFSGSLACTAPQAAVMGLKGDAEGAWIACGGSCRVVQYPDRVSIEFDSSTQDVAGGRFLHGNRATACLSTLPLSYDESPGSVTLLHIEPADATTRIGAEIALGELEVFPDTARLSCDGSRLIAQDVYGDGGLLIFDTETGAAITPSEQQDAWVLTSPDGSHVVALAEFGDHDGYLVVDLDTNATLEVHAAHEIDLPAFGTDNSFALVRMAKTPVRTELYDLKTGSAVQTLDAALPLGLPFALIDGKVQSLAKPPQK